MNMTHVLLCLVPYGLGLLPLDRAQASALERTSETQRQTRRIDDGEMEWLEGVEEWRSLFSL